MIVSPGTGEVTALVARMGLLPPRDVVLDRVPPEGRVLLFDEAELARLRKIPRLTEDLGLDEAGVEIALHLLDEVEAPDATIRWQTGDDIVAPSGPRSDGHPPVR